MQTFIETLYDGYTQGLSIEKVYFESHTEHQHLMIFHNAIFGRVMVLDGIVQTTERDEFIYHEMLAHTPLFAHPTPSEVLVIGGGDGGMLREIVKHARLRAITQVEIDASVIEMSKAHLPNHSQGAFDDPRVEVVIADGMAFVADTPKRFDVIISDSTDPIGPGEVLFSEDFYAACRRCLKPGGVLVTQNGVVFLQPDEVQNTARRFSNVFADWHFYGASVPTYVGGIMTFGWASDDPSLRKVSPDVLRGRFDESGIATRYYTPELHSSSFALPRYVLDLIGKPR
ncbi:MAG: polyamine aminopropyltransferase [Pseudomonadota bacterium]